VVRPRFDRLHDDLVTTESRHRYRGRTIRAQADGVPASIAVKPRASRRWGVACCSRTAFPETKRLGSTEEVSQNRIAGIRNLIEGCVRIESIREEMRDLVASCWPDLVRKLPPKN
jgi:hypothetical protein